MKKEQLLVIGGAAVIGCVAYYIWRKKKHPKREIGSVGGAQYDTAYSYEEAVKKAREKINAGLKDDRVRLVPTLEKPNLKIQAVKQEDMKNYNTLASEYDSIFDNVDLTVVDDSDTEPGLTVEPTWDTEWWHDLDNDDDVQPKYAEPAEDLTPEKREEAVKAENVWVPMRDDDLGAYFRISEDKYKHENLEFAKEQGVFNAENKALMLANQGILGPETELFRRVATLVFEDEEDFADAVFFENISKKIDVKITVQM